MALNFARVLCLPPFSFSLPFPPTWGEWSPHSTKSLLREWLAGAPCALFLKRSERCPALQHGPHGSCALTVCSTPQRKGLYKQQVTRTETAKRTEAPKWRSGVGRYHVRAPFHSNGTMHAILSFPTLGLALRVVSHEPACPHTHSMFPWSVGRSVCPGPKGVANSSIRAVLGRKQDAGVRSVGQGDGGDCHAGLGAQNRSVVLSEEQEECGCWQRSLGDGH